MHAVRHRFGDVERVDDRSTPWGKMGWVFVPNEGDKGDNFRLIMGAPVSLRPDSSGTMG